MFLFYLNVYSRYKTLISFKYKKNKKRFITFIKFYDRFFMEDTSYSITILFV